VKGNNTSKADRADLAAKHNSPLLVTQKDGLKAYADFETACSAEAANFDEHARTIVSELMFAPMYVVQLFPTCAGRVLPVATLSWLSVN
jgi:hypothetical protein